MHELSSCNTLKLASRKTIAHVSHLFLVIFARMGSNVILENTFSGPYHRFIYKCLLFLLKWNLFYGVNECNYIVLYYESFYKIFGQSRSNSFLTLKWIRP